MASRFIWPLAGIGSVALLSAAGLFIVVVRKKQVARLSGLSLFQSSTTQTPGATIDQPTFAYNNHYAQPTEAISTQNKDLAPFAMQGIAQYSPLLGAADSSRVDAPVAPPSDFRPLTLDFPQILEIHTDKVPAQMAARFLPPITGDIQPEFRLASTQFSPTTSSSHTPTPSSRQSASPPYQFPAYDPTLESLIRQAQMGIFALPGKNSGL